MRKEPTMVDLSLAIQRTEDLEHAAAADITEKDKGLRLFGNNFSRIFDAMLDEAERGIRIEEDMRSYLDKAESLGEPWQQFVLENQELIQNIFLALREHRIYKNLLDLFIKIGCTISPQEKGVYTQRVLDRVSPELGFTAIQVPIYKRLNPLLEEAARKLEEKGINAEEQLYF